MLSLSRSAQTFELFKNLYPSGENEYDYEKVIDFFKLWEERDLAEFMKKGDFAFGVKDLMTNIGLAKGLPKNSALLAKDVFMHMMKDQFFCSMLYMFGRDKKWLNSKMSISEASQRALDEIKTEDSPPTVLSMHYGPYRAVPPFVSLFERPFLIPHTENEYSDIFKEKGIIPDAIELHLIDDDLPQKMVANFKGGKGLFLLGDYSTSPRRSRQTATLFQGKIHAPSGGMRIAQNLGSSLYLMRIKSQDPCNFDVKVDKVIGASEWESDSKEQLLKVNQQCFDWFTQVIESDPAPWQGWHRFKHIVAQEE
ncbi:MAG: hypothetical protein CMH56_10075 [Myxococcales bacterium]|nr:hypothetical protein [Myxococcales bacterium]|tara:strand:- start:295 stop:1221 length:927 start_codon:yes stop_codon:yes gene_type:complete